MAHDEYELPTDLTYSSRVPSSHPHLLALWNGGSVSRPLTKGESITIGRGRDCDLVIDHPSVSRRHAILLCGPPLNVEDLGSANGTHVGGVPLPSLGRAPLAPGQAVAIGAAVVMVVGTLEAPASEPPSALRRRHDGDEDVVVNDEAMREIHRLVELVAKSSVSIVLLGQTGVGKDVLAEAIHRRSPRAARPFVRVNCAAMPAALLESELFGFERGAFTGAGQAKPGLVEVADGGTLFLDEIGEMPPAMQSKLLHVLERNEVMRVGSLRPRAIDVRFVAATNRALDKMVESGSFRADLYYRLHGMSITIPRLAARRSEIAPLARLFVQRACVKQGRPALLLAPAAIERLERYDWPGNVRELRNAMDRATALCGEGETIEVAHLPVECGRGIAPERAEDASAPSAPPPSAVPNHAPRATRALDRQQIVEALARCGGNQSSAATLLGVSRRTLVTRLGEYDIPRPLKRRS